METGGTGGVFVGALIEEDLVVDGLVGIEGAPVGQDHGAVPGGIVRADGLPHLIAEAVLQRTALPAVDAGDGLDGPAPVVVVEP